MNKHEKIVQAQFLNNEEAVIKALEKTYSQALKDIEKKSQRLYDDINDLQSLINTEADADEKARLISMKQSKVYQKQYQDALKKQINGILDTMQAEQFTTVSDYLKKCYEDGFVGTMYSLHAQGIPLIFPIDQEAVTRAVQIDSKISNSLYTLCGENVDDLKKHIAAEVSRGIATGASFHDIARQIRANMIGTYDKAGGALYRSELIARTEGHRVQIQSAMDACYKAKDRGADVVKQWDSTLDSRTRESHQIVDGEIRELDEKFSNGLRYPGDSAGGAAEVCNCRCALLQRSRKALDDEELETLKKRAEYFGLDKTENFEDFKKKYLKAAEESSVVDEIKPNLDNKYMKDLDIRLKIDSVEYRAVAKHKTPLTDDEIIDALGGGDMTRGSCASLGLAYMGQKGGLNVLDFRDGASRNFFSKTFNLETICRLPGVKSISETAKSAVTAGNKLLKRVEVGREYYFVCGRHAAIVRKKEDGILQYLELQSATRNGWHNFDEKPRYTLSSRFGDYRLGGFDVEAFMIDVDSFKDSDDLRHLLGYINTAEDRQRKGKHGTIK